MQQLKDGKKLVLTGFPVFDGKGDLCLVVTFARDVTLLAQLQDQVAGQCKLIDQINDQLAYIAQGAAKSREPVYASRAMLSKLQIWRCVSGLPKPSVQAESMMMVPPGLTTARALASVLMV